MRSRYIGMDIGGTKCAVILAEVRNGIQFIDRIQFNTCAERGFDYTWERLCAAADDILLRNGLSKEQLIAIGVSCGGPLDSARGVVLSPPNLPGWRDVPLCDMLSSRFSCPAYLQNDANACALVEWKLGAGRGAKNMIFLTMGTGIGGGVIAEGRLLIGNTDMGGEIGHLRLAPDGPVGFGKAGSFEGFTSGGGIARQAAALTQALLAAGKTPAWTADGVTLKALDAGMMASYARRGDADARAFFEEIGRRLGQGLALLVDAFNPEKIVIGSIFVRCEDLLRPAMEAELRREALSYSLNGLSVLPAQTGEKLGDYSSIMAALYALDVDPFMNGEENKPDVLAHFERLFARYPQLIPCRDSVMDAYLTIRDAYLRNGKLLVAGNGGSCADGEHIVGELMKGFLKKRPLPDQLRAEIDLAAADLVPGAGGMLQQGLPAIALTGHNALTTAVANDLDSAVAYAQQLMGYGRRGDVLLGISTSGNAKNIALAVKTAKLLGMYTVGMTGENGGLLKTLCDVSICVPENSTADIQELHLPVYHTLCAMLEAKFFDA